MKQDHNTLTALFEKPKTVSLTSSIMKYIVAPSPLLIFPVKLI